MQGGLTKYLENRDIFPYMDFFDDFSNFLGHPVPNKFFIANIKTPTENNPACKIPGCYYAKVIYYSRKLSWMLLKISRYYSGSYQAVT